MVRLSAETEREFATLIGQAEATAPVAGTLGRPFEPKSGVTA